MLSQKAPPLIPFGASYRASESASTQSLFPSQQNSATGDFLPIGRQAMPLFAQKAAAVLDSEVKDFAVLGTELFAKISNSGLPGSVGGTERFRQQARELVDVLVKMLEHWPESSSPFESAAAGRHRGDEPQCIVPVLKPPPPVSSGQAAQVLLTLENDDTDEAVECSVFTTDIIGTSGHRIPAVQVNVSPSQLRILPSSSIEVNVEIRVPRETPPGTYSGLLQVYDGRLEQAVLQFLVRA